MYILDELYAGNVNPSEHAFQKDDPYAKAMDKLVEAEEQLSRKLDDAGKEQLKRLQECQAEVNSADAFYAFQTGFQLGVRLMLQAAAPAQAGLFFWMKSRSSLGCSALRSYRKHSGRNTPTLAGVNP